MIPTFKDYFLKEKNIQVVGIRLDTDAVYQYLKVAYKNNQLEIVSRESNLDFETLQTKLDKNSPVALHFSGKGILHKKTKAIPDYKSKVLMNVAVSDFYFYELIQDKDVFLSVIRKTILDAEFKKMAEANALVIDYSIGSFVASSLKSFLEDQNIPSNDINLEFENTSLVDFTPLNSSPSITIGAQQLSSYEVSLFATALNYYIQNDDFIYDKTILESNRSENKFRKYFNALGVVGLAFFFLTLLGSYLLLDYYNTKIVETNMHLSMVQDSFSRIQELEEERNEKRKILNESGVFTHHFLSYYTNELTHELPPSIVLNQLDIFPNVKKIKPEEKIEFTAQTIIMAGVSGSNDAFNQWYKRLKDISWIQKIDIDKYQTNKEESYDFEIKIVIKK